MPFVTVRDLIPKKTRPVKLFIRKTQEGWALPSMGNLRLVDAETGEMLHGVKNVEVSAPIGGIISVKAEFIICDLETVDRWPDEPSYAELRSSVEKLQRENDRLKSQGK